MVDRRGALALFAGMTGGTALGAQDQGNVTWVANVLKRMETIKGGMTRETLLTVFTTEGGLSTGLQRTYVSQECPYFKVDVEFDAVGRPNRDSDGRVTLIEDPRDIILKLSRPYLQFSILD
jgi:hypothetical protein